MESLLLGQRSAVFDQVDPHRVSDYVNQHVGQHCISLAKSARPQANLNHRKFAQLDLCRISYGGSVRVVSPALENLFHLQVLLQGQCLWRGPQHEQYLLPGELLLINPDDPVDLTYSEDCEKFILKVPVAVLESVCDDQRWQRPAGGVRFLRNHYQLTELEGFTNLLAMICQEAEAQDSLLRVQEHYTQIIGTKLLSLLHCNVSREEQGSASVSLGRIQTYIDSHLSHKLAAAELAEHACISLRALYGLFERQLGLSPMQYVRQRKLARIHACLIDPHCTVRSLTELAMDYGFVHLGRFAESYRQQFGELPSATFKRRH
ncbi:AraC family transcriptional regulator [Pseudomonas sp. 5P_3.1_Bac2]|uniref:AraC family transcriptional regulator n=1 Tax=Pseudomonas sp. 5P_3.1_Bac2 TaxID=2971617 RepID=UPI0021C62F31|nr:AraC family transcriptional regulator [Pseudomonas sp. 5P_3.1_Bac2]MCU1716926.1 AraC family transcriptional regulator [Pseudomonas sp. 5P_3.1_Bac2]